MYDAETSEDEGPKQRGKVYDEKRGRDTYYSEEEEEEEVKPMFTKKTPLQLKNALTLQIKRKHLARLLEQPYLQEFVKGKFCKLKVGVSKSSAKDIYKMCVVEGLVDHPGKSYSFSAPKVFSSL